MKQKFGLNFPRGKVINGLPDTFLHKIKFLILIPLFLSMYACGGGAVDATASGTNTGTTVTGGTAGSTGSTYTGSIQVSWNPPASYTNGTALSLSEIKSYTLRYGTQSGNYSGSIVINNPSTTSYTITGLAHGKYFLTVTVKLVDGLESVYSNEVTRTL